jgi:hypothetical protein
MAFNTSTYVGVLEFTSIDDHCILPDWMFEHLNCATHNPISVCLNTELPKGKMIKI